MSRTRFNKINCGVAQALDQLGDDWTSMRKLAVALKASVAELVAEAEPARSRSRT